MKVTWHYTSPGGLLPLLPHYRFAEDNQLFTRLANVVHEQSEGGRHCTMEFSKSGRGSKSIKF